jgi:alpha-beta hydrolase superfamily lysophospholipase
MNEFMYDNFVSEAIRRGPCLPQTRVRITTSDHETVLAGLFGDDVEATQVMIFFHGAGANMNVSYLNLAKAVYESSGTTMLVPDLRGHGMSSGDRGFAESKERVWLDVDEWIAFARERFPQAQVVLGGHSAGTALILNYMTLHQRERTDTIVRLVMLAPYWGARSNLRSPDSHGDSEQCIPNFSTRDTQVFMAYALSGDERYRRQIAVRFNYPEDMARLTRLVTGYTPEMVIAVLPQRVTEQLATLAAPVLVLAAEDNALFSPTGLADLVEEANNPAIAFHRISGDHLSCLYEAGPQIARWLAAPVGAAV